MELIMDDVDALRADIRKALEEIDGERAQATRDHDVIRTNQAYESGYYYGGKATGLEIARSIVAKLLDTKGE